MSLTVRVWLDPKKLQIARDEKRLFPYVMLTGGTRLNLFEDHGLPYFHCGLDTPIHPELRGKIARVTVHTTVTSRDQMASIKRGRYVHGKFEATVTEDREEHGSTLTVTVSAPTKGQLTRWLHPLLAGELVPKTEYGRRPETRPTIPGPAEA